MIRFPNPGSDIDSFIRIFRELFRGLNQYTNFDLDIMSEVIVEKRLATSSGYMGKEALKRSFNKDRSRDPIYNQLKMYSELYKALGWIHPEPDSALNFHFTYLGAHIAEANDPDELVKESVLGIAYPNAILNVRGDHILRPFATIIRTIGELDGLLCRDEMIVGPLHLDDDTDPNRFASMISELRYLRSDWSYLQTQMEELSRERGIKINTMTNYTRWPLAIMKWTNWAKSQSRKDIYGKNIGFLVLTETGRQILDRVDNSYDIRAKDLEAIDNKTKDAVSRIGFYQMLDRAGFDTTPQQFQIDKDLEQSSHLLHDQDRSLLFSPFQELSPAYVNSLFPFNQSASETTAATARSTMLKIFDHHPITQISLSQSKSSNTKWTDQDLITYFNEVSISVGGNLEEIAEHIANQHSGTNQDVFYPFVSRLFRALGYDCECSRTGVNYQRWDALIIDPQHSIPIEIKSPGEEEFLSVKAIRQALENKIILLSRKPFPTQPTTTSLAVGYKLPHDRSEVSTLISDIHTAFGITIGVIDLKSLLYLVAANFLQDYEHNVEQLRHLHGIIDIENP